MKRILYKILVILLIISLFLTFILSNKPSIAAPKTDDFYYHVTVDNICGTTYRSMYEVDPYGEINKVPNRITIEKIVFNEIPLFDANVFDFDKVTIEDYAE